MKIDVWKYFSSFQKRSDFSSIGDLLQKRRWGRSVHREQLEMIPLFGSACSEKVFAEPADAIRLTKVTNYGQMILENMSKLPAIVPLHIGYFQNAAQNHAMCISALLKPGESKEFKDACCIQQAQGGYIAEADERFIVLPQPLRKKALSLAGEEKYSKLWEDISVFNKQLGLKARGHLDEMKRAYQPELLRTVYYLEQHSDQTGAIFLFNDKVVGIELAPSPSFWTDLHIPLVMYSYAPLRLLQKKERFDQRENNHMISAPIKTPDDLAVLWSSLDGRRGERIDNIIASLKSSAITDMTIQESQANNRMATIETQEFVGQAVIHNHAPAYVSLIRK